MLIRKVINLLLIKCMFKRTLSVTPKLLITLVILLDKSIKFKVLSKKLKKNGKILMSVFKHIKKHIN